MMAKVVMRIVVGLFVVLAPDVARAQPGPPAPQSLDPAAADPGPAICTPPCRSGYLCHEGACISACNPGCGDNELCTRAGECVSRCNPVCDAGQQCTSSGACIGGSVPSRPLVGGNGAGWASTATKLGIVSAVAIAGLTAGIVIADDEDIGIPLGITATVVAGVTIPIVAVGGASGRGTGATGNPGLRIAGWVFYTLSLADAVALLGIALSDGDVPAGIVGSVGALGATSAVFMSIDALQTSRQARRGWQPYASVLRDARGDTTPVIGVTCGF